MHRSASCRLAIVVAIATLTYACAEEDHAVPTPSARAAAASIEAQAAPTAAPTDSAALQAQFADIEAGARHAPRDYWDPAYVVDLVGRDPKSLQDWVRRNTTWSPYRGVLKGPTGVLLERRGNNLDRAILLAALMRHAGHEVRLAHAQVSVAMARSQLSRALSEPVAAPEPFPIVSQTATALEAAGFEPARTAALLDTQVAYLSAAVDETRQRSHEQAELLRELIAPNLARGREDVENRIEQAAQALRDEWWVQRQEGERWVDHRLTDWDKFIAAESTLDPEDVPAELRHEVVVRFVVARNDGSRRKETVALEHLLRPSELIGTSVVFQSWPTSWPSHWPEKPADRQLLLEQTARDEESWGIALIVGGRNVADAIVSAAEKAVDANRGSSGGAFSALARGLERRNVDATTECEMSAAWIEYELRSPSLPVRVYRSRVFDVGTVATLQPAQQLARGLSMTMRTEILPTVSELPDVYLGHLAAESLLRNRELMVAALTGADLHDLEEFPRKPVGADPLSPLYVLAHGRFAWSFTADVHLAQPNILSRHIYLAPTTAGIVIRDAIDIVNNEVVPDPRVQDGFGARLKQGVLDTNVEFLVRTPGRYLGNTAAAFADATNPWQARSVSVAAAPSLLAAEAFYKFRDEPAANMLVVAPRAVESAGLQRPSLAWRIDPLSGDTLGIDADGWGTSMTERSLLVSMAAQFARGFLFETLLCHAVSQVVNEAHGYANMALDWTTEYMVDEQGRRGLWWVRPRQARLDSYDVFKGSFKGCLISAIVQGGIFATAPLLMRGFSGERALAAPRGANPRLGTNRLHWENDMPPNHLEDAIKNYRENYPDAKNLPPRLDDLGANRLDWEKGMKPNQLEDAIERARRQYNPPNLPPPRGAAEAPKTVRDPPRVVRPNQPSLGPPDTKPGSSFGSSDTVGASGKGRTVDLGKTSPNARNVINVERPAGGPGDTTPGQGLELGDTLPPSPGVSPMATTGHGISPLATTVPGSTSATTIPGAGPSSPPAPSPSGTLPGIGPGEAGAAGLADTLARWPP